RPRGGIAPPRERVGVTERTTRLRRNRVQVVWEAFRSNRSEHVVGQREVLRVAPIVRNVGVDELRHAEEVVVDIVILDEIELVHPAAVDGRVSIVPSVTWVARRAIRALPQRYALTCRNHTARGPVRSRERPEVIVERPILLDDVDDVLNLRPERLDVARRWRRDDGDVLRSRGAEVPL